VPPVSMPILIRRVMGDIQVSRRCRDDGTICRRPRGSPADVARPLPRGVSDENPAAPEAAEL